MTRFNLPIAIALALLCALTAPAQQAVYVLTDGAGITRQSLLPSTDRSKLDSALVRAAWDADDHIISAGFTAHGLQLTIASHPSWGNQTYALESSYPADFISDMLQRGFRITELTTDGSQWLAVATEGTDYSTQYFFSFPTPATDDDLRTINEAFTCLSDASFFITDCTYSEPADTWTIVASNTGRPMTQKWDFLYSPNDVIQFFNTNQADGYRFSAIDYGNGRYLAVMARNPQIALGQTVSINPPDPEALFRSYWDRGFIITQIGH